MTTYLDGLNECQLSAVKAPLGNIMVLAGAGSGKTRVLVSRMAHLMTKEVISPHAILAVTFTNKAAGEMKARLSDLLACPLQGLWVGTFHGLCHRLLRRHYEEANLPESFHIMDTDDQARLLKRVMASLNLDMDKWPVKKAQSFINGHKDEGLRPQHIEVLPYGPTKTWLKIYQSYEQACQTAGLIDFAELLLRCHELLRDNPALLAHYQQRFRAILVDEFQDTNTIQYAWIRLLAGEGVVVMAVGDDDQSIYGWRGAKIENIHRFSRDFPNTQLIRLEQNYRSTAIILDAANALITHNQSRMGKHLWTVGDQGQKILVFSAFNELEEARFVADRIKMEMAKGRQADEMAILYRSNAQSRLLEEFLLRAGVAYQIYGGVRFFERAEIKDALAYLRLMVHPDDDASFERVINFPTRGIGEKTLNELRVFAKLRSGSLWQATQQLLKTGELNRRACDSLSKFMILIERLQASSANLGLDEQIKTVIHLSGLYDHYANLKGEKSASKLDNLQELINAGKQFCDEQSDENESLSLVSFLAHASLEAGETQTKDKACVHLMTLHAAKGLEYPLVFLVGLEEGLFPSQQSIQEPERLEEERRLCYVGMTRAMEQLVMTYAEIRRQYGQEKYHRPSRFLRELPEACLDEVRPKASIHPPPVNQSISPRFVEDSGFKVGQSVHHAKFGQGFVLATEGSGDHARVQVKFEKHGSKWLVLAYANLTRRELHKT